MKGQKKKIEWRPFDKDEFPDPSSSVESAYLLPMGYVARDRNGNVWFVGDINGNGYDYGCGCCSEKTDIVEIADLIGDIEGLDR